MTFMSKSSTRLLISVLSITLIQFLSHGLLGKKRMPGEQTNDERIHVAEVAFKIEVVIAGIDTVSLQLNDIFAEENVQFQRVRF